MRKKYKEKQKIHKGCNGVHDGTIDMLIERLTNKGIYDEIGRNKTYSYKDKGHLIFGEMDAYALTTINGKQYVFLFEIKTNHSNSNYRKAKKQLTKDRKYMDYNNIGDRFFKFYVTKDLIKYIK